MHGRTLLLPLLALTSVALACNNDKPKADPTPVTATTSAAAATVAAAAATGAPSGSVAAVPPAAASGAPSAAVAAATTTAAATGAAPAGNVTYTPFTQKSHGYSLEIPGVFASKSNPKNTDGQDWSWGDHANVTTVSLPSLGESLDDYFAEATTERKGITDKQKKDNWFMIKGADKGKNFVEKSFVTGSSKTDLDITYDDSLKGQIEPMIQHMLDTFKPGK